LSCVFKRTNRNPPQGYGVQALRLFTRGAEELGVTVAAGPAWITLPCDDGSRRLPSVSGANALIPVDSALFIEGQSERA